MSLIEIRNLRKEYSPDVVPLKGVNANIEAGEVISIIGPSGTGKSTLLRCINRLETPTSGQIIVDGVDVCAPGTDLARLRKSMGMVFQSFNLFPHKMAVENIMLPQQSLLGKSAREAYEEAMKQLERVGLADRARQYPDELSGGQKQRVAIARALAMHPQILLFDEPTSALDPTMVSEVLSVIRDLAGTGLTMLLVTHEMRLARHVSDRVFFMTDGEIYEEGSPEQIFEHPLREGTRNFIFRIRSWTCILSPSSRDFHGMTGSLEKFCKDQFLGRRQAMNCQLAVEELVVSFLLPAVESAGQGAFHMTLFAGEEGAERKLMIDCSGFPEGKKIFDELLKNIPAEASKAAESVKFPSFGAGTMEAASAAILENVLRRLPDEGEDTVVFRIL
jgi:polar amino acid transport system ATP-binding protein